MREPSTDKRNAERVDEQREVWPETKLEEFEASVVFTLLPHRSALLVCVTYSTSPSLAEREI